MAKEIVKTNANTGTLNEDVAAAIKTQFERIDAVMGSAQLLDMNTHTDGVDYTAGGQLTARWVDRDKIQQRRAEGFRNPSEYTARFRDVSMGKLILMLRPAHLSKRYFDVVEERNSHWEAQTREKLKNSKQSGLGEFDVKPQRALPG